MAGVLGFEPEFRGESPPSEGSDATDFTAFYVARLAPGASAELAVARLRALFEVAAADRIALLPVSVIPGDSLFAYSWWFYDTASRGDVHGPEAFPATTLPAVIAAVFTLQGEVTALLDVAVAATASDLERVDAGIRALESAGKGLEP